MFYFSELSKTRLRTCHKDLRKLFNEIIKTFDCSIICGFRSKVAQDYAFKEGLSTKKWPDSKHNASPSMAIDAAPYIEGVGPSWQDRRIYYFAGYVKRIAEEMGIKIRLGADWDSDNDTEDHNFRDAGHFELV